MGDQPMSQSNMVNSAENEDRVAEIVAMALRQPPVKRNSYLRFAVLTIRACIRRR